MKILNDITCNLNWIDLKIQIELSLNWIELNWIELNWIEIELKKKWDANLWKWNANFKN